MQNLVSKIRIFIFNSKLHFIYTSRKNLLSFIKHFDVLFNKKLSLDTRRISNRITSSGILPKNHSIPDNQAKDIQQYPTSDPDK